MKPHIGRSRASRKPFSKQATGGRWLTFALTAAIALPLTGFATPSRDEFSQKVIAQSANGPQAGLFYFVDSDGDGGLVGSSNFCNDGTGHCTLRAAIEAANLHPGADGIGINLPAGSSINLTHALSDLTEGVSISGPGADQLTVQRFTGGSYRIFNVTTNSAVTFSGMAIVGGSIVGQNGGDGGGIQNLNSATVNITHCTIRQNHSTPDSAGAGKAGGIYNNSSGTVNITDSAISANVASGIFNNANGTVTVTNSTISDNVGNNVGDFGGGIFNNGLGTVTVSNSTLSHNSTNSNGGGISNNGGSLNVTNSTLSNNSAVFGGGIYNIGGGAVNLTNSTLSANFAQFGAGIYNNFDATSTVTNCTISGNNAMQGGGILTETSAVSVMQVHVKSSIIALNSASSSGQDVSGTFDSHGFNLIGKTDRDGFAQPTDQTGTIASPLDPRLDPNGLKDNGGPTQSIVALVGSPAIDKGTSAGLTGNLTTDQRGPGFQRTIDVSGIANASGGDGTDIGAIESHTPTAASATISGQITTTDGSPLAGVTVQLLGQMSATTIANSAGDYRFDNVDTDGFYTVTPSLVNFTFNPANRSFSLVGDQSDAVFTANRDAHQSANAIDTNEYFVRQQYLDLLDREPDQGGFEYWSGQLNQCNGNSGCIRGRRIDVSAAFFVEQEFQQTGSFIYDLYVSGLGRKPLFAEYSSDRSQVVGGASLEAEKESFTESLVRRAEFGEKYPASMTGQSFVDALLESVWRSSGVDLSGERDNLTTRYNSGNGMIQSRGFVLREVADNPGFQQAEYNPAFVLMQYFGYLRRDVDQGGYDFWLGVVNNREPNNYHGMVCSFITSTEYQQRFGSLVTRSNADCAQ